MQYILKSINSTCISTVVLKIHPEFTLSRWLIPTCCGGLKTCIWSAANDLTKPVIFFIKPCHACNRCHLTDCASQSQVFRERVVCCRRNEHRIFWFIDILPIIFKSLSNYTAQFMTTQTTLFNIACILTPMHKFQSSNGYSCKLSLEPFTVVLVFHIGWP